MELEIKKGADGYTSVKAKGNLPKYYFISLLFYLIVGELWRRYEIYAYGEIRPDHFDGMILLVLSITIGALLFFKDFSKALLDTFPVSEIKEEES